MTHPVAMRFVGTLVAALLAITISGCGSDEPVGTQDTGPSAAEIAAQKIDDGRASCSAWIQGLQTELTELDSRIAIGMVFQDYITAVGDVRVAYDAIDTANLPEPYCLGEVATPLEGALNAHGQAADLWNDCIGNFRCDFEGERLPQLQQLWSDAGAAVAQAATALEEYEHPDVYVPPTAPPAVLSPERRRIS